MNEHKPETLSSVDLLQKNTSAIISALTSGYICLYYVEVRTGKYREFHRATVNSLEEYIGERGDIAPKLSDVCEKFISPEYRSVMLAFMDLSTLNERLRKRDSISARFYGVHKFWACASFTVAERDADGNCTHVLFAVSDINDQVEQEMAQHNDLRKLEMMIDASNIGTWEIRVRNGEYRMHIDKRMRDHFGMDESMSDEDVAREMVERVNPEDRKRFDIYNADVVGGKMAKCIFRWNHPTLGERYFSSGGARISEPDAEETILSGYQCDVTEQTRLKEELERSIATGETKTRFMQNLSHEVRTPLNALFGFSQLLGMPDGTWSEQDKDRYNNIIYNSYNMLDMLINDILDSTSLKQGNYRTEMSEFHINEVGRNALSSVEFRRPGSVELKFSSDLDDDCTMVSDPRRIQQILINFLTNACKNTSAGEIHIHITGNDKPGIIVFSCTDTGKGVPVDKAEAIFGRYTKLDQNVQGSGLGLNICDVIARKLNARIYLDTTYTGGARFKLEVPVGS